MRCLITGSQGLIGTRLKSLMTNWEIFTVDKKLSPTNDPFTPIVFDLSNSLYQDVFPDQMDIIIHLAQFDDFRNFPERAEEMFTVNTMSTLRLLEYARRVGVRTFILASSGGVYGSGEDSFKEDSVLASCEKMNFYIITKNCSEALAQQYGNYMNVIILRFFFVYGVGQRPDMLVPRLINSVRQGNPIILQGENGLLLNPTHVSDAAKAIYKATSLNKNHIINVAGPETLSMREIGYIIGNQLGKEPVFHIENNVQPQSLIGDTQKMSCLLIKPTVTFQEGIKELLS